MGENQFAGGVWPVMLTPFTDHNEVDYPALERLTEWYIENGVSGLFAVCQSSEMFFLSLEERVKIAGFVKEKAAGRETAAFRCSAWREPVQANHQRRIPGRISQRRPPAYSH